MITKAAVKDKDGIIFSKKPPNRHNHILHDEHFKILMQKPVKQGFMTSENEFVDRKTAAKIALDCNQIEKLQHPPNLYTEDLWTNENANKKNSL